MKDVQRRVEEVHNALADFIIDATKKGAPGYAVQALPEAAKIFHEISNSLHRHTPKHEITDSTGASHVNSASKYND